MIMASWNIAQVLWDDMELCLSNIWLVAMEPVPEGSCWLFLSLDIFI